MEDRTVDHEGANRRRVLHEVVSLKLWFEAVNGDERKSAFHATVAFSDARLGEEEEASEVRFNLSVKRCDIVFIPPSDPQINVDPKSVKIPPPLKPLKQRELEARKSQYGWSATLKATIGKKVEGGGALEAGASREREGTLVNEQEISPHGEAWKETHDGYDAWEVKGDLLEGGRLQGTIWSAHDGARLHLVDKRAQEVIERERKRQMEPEARLEIRCRSEDLDIYGIEFKDPARKVRFESKSYKAEKLLAAREFIRSELSGRLLQPSNIGKNTAAKVKIADVTIKIS